MKAACWISKSHKRRRLHPSQFLPRGHSPDVAHMETTATMLPSTLMPQLSEQRSEPNIAQNMTNVMIVVAKYMLPTSPVARGWPCISIVFARHAEGHPGHGVKPFVLQLHDGRSMTPCVL
jgi:acyl-CoA oxidase